jgi:hypothetical protein
MQEPVQSHMVIWLVMLGKMCTFQISLYGNIVLYFMKFYYRLQHVVPIS